LPARRKGLAAILLRKIAPGAKGRFDITTRQNREAIFLTWPHGLRGYKKPLGAQGIAAEILFVRRRRTKRLERKARPGAPILPEKSL
jgi:hypothetical protein